MIADTIDAMTTDRPYRAALTFDEVVAELGRYSGIQFDPELVEVLSRSQVIRKLVGSSRVPLVSPPETREGAGRLIAVR